MEMNKKETKEIHRLLEKTLITPDIVNQWYVGEKTAMIQQLQPLNNYLRNHSPQKLYKMRRFSTRSIDAFEKGLIILPQAISFNDPYDCFLSFDIDRIEKHIEISSSMEMQRAYLQTLNLSFPVDNHFQSFEELATEIHKISKQILANVIDSLPSLVNKLQCNTYIAALTESIHSPIMWSHYADMHKGFALEYQFPDRMFNPSPMLVSGDDVDYNWYGWRTLLPVLYSPNREDGTDLANWFALCELFNIALGKQAIKRDMNDFMPDMLLKTKLCLHKAQEWSYEREWRLMISHNWPNQIKEPLVKIEFPPSAVYLGAKMEQSDRDRIIEIAKRKQIPIYQTFINPSSNEYSMETKLVDQ